ncbi:MAG: DUF4836 family protein [Bacteroidaceae bacterium]|nr:DUF4836 family protein [Bacteroidaceae bacterium]
MKKIYVVSLVALMVMALCSCSKTDYQKVIPANAALVVKVDVKAIAEKSEFSKSKTMQKVEKSLSLVVKDKDMKRVKDYMEDPMSMGIDFSVPAYVFMVDKETFGLTMKVNDKDDVKDFLQLLNKQGMASKPQEKNERMCGTLLDDFSYTYDGTTFLLLASMNNAGGAKNGKLAQQLMKLDEKDSFVSTDGFSRLEDEDMDVSAYMNFAVLPADILGFLAEWLPKSVYKDIYGLASLNFEKGSAQLTSKMFAKTDAAQKVIDEANEHLKKIDGRYLDKVSDDAAMWLGAGVKGDWLLGKMKENKNLNSMLFAVERAIDIEQMFRAVDGDVSMELSSFNSETNEPDYVTYAELKDKKFLDDVDDWKESQKEYGIEMKSQGNNQYALSMDGQTFNWGVDGDDLYMGTPLALGHAKKSTGALLKDYKDEIKESRMFIYLNLAAMGKQSGGMSSTGLAFLSLGNALKAITMKLVSMDELSLTVESNNKEENFLKILLFNL